MANLPAAIVFINQDITEAQRVFIGQQLFADEIISKNEFDSRIAADYNYPAIVRAMRSRVVVILSTFHDLVNRDAADVVLFFKNGLATIEGNNYGPPKLSIDQQRLDIYTILRFVKNDQVVSYKFGSSCCGFKCECCLDDCKCCHDINCPSCAHGLGGIFAIQTRAENCGVHAANCDNLAHNEAFKARNY